MHFALHLVRAGQWAAQVCACVLRSIVTVFPRLTHVFHPTHELRSALSIEDSNVFRLTLCHLYFAVSYLFSPTAFDDMAQLTSQFHH